MVMPSKNCETACLSGGWRPGRKRHRRKQAVSPVGFPYDPPPRPLSEFQFFRPRARESKSQESHRASTTRLNPQPGCRGGTSSEKFRRSSPPPRDRAAHVRCDFALGLRWFEICQWGRARANLGYSINRGVSLLARPPVASFDGVLQERDGWLLEFDSPSEPIVPPGSPGNSRSQEAEAIPDRKSVAGRK